jgi:SAM-dependent methyltransferase
METTGRRAQARWSNHATRLTPEDDGVQRYGAQVITSERIRAVAACPRCKSGSLVWEPSAVSCPSCGSSYGIRNGTPMLMAENASPNIREFDRGLLERLPRPLRPTAARARRFVRPLLTHRSRRTRDVIPAFIRSRRQDETILNIGAGSTDYGPHVLNLDIAPGAAIHVVGVAEALPFCAESFDAVVFQAVLEHVLDAREALAEIRRVLRPGGSVLIEVPFMQGYHAAPADYRRYTEVGLRTELTLNGFVVEDGGIAVGPASAMAWVSAEFLALLLSGRSARGYRVARVVTTWLAWPLKWSDSWLEGHEMAHVIASGVWAQARRPDR